MPEKRLASLHLIARHDDQAQKLVRVGPGEFESGNWAVTKTQASQAVGAQLHLHERQAEPSWIAGLISGWRPSAVEPERMVFRFKIDRSLLRKQRSGWGREIAWVWHEA